MADLLYSDIETRVMNQLRISTGSTGELAKVQALVNEVYRDIYVKHDWWWAVKRTEINTLRSITSGTASVAFGSQSITLSTDVSVTSSNVQGSRFIVPASTAPFAYLISDYASATRVATLFDATYPGATSTAATYQIYRDRYPLPTDCSKVFRTMRGGFDNPLERVGPEEMESFKINDYTVGSPQVYCVDDFIFSSSGGSGGISGRSSTVSAKLLQIHPYPDQSYRLSIAYKRTLNTESTGFLLIPDEHINVLIYGTLGQGYPVFLSDMERGAYYAALYQARLDEMILRQREYTGDHTAITPKNDYRRAQRRPSAGYTLGSWFDRLPSAP